MSSFIKALTQGLTQTTNGQAAEQTTGSDCLDLFGIMPSINTPHQLEYILSLALEEDFNKACKIIQWTRDIRSGAGRRQTFRNALQYFDARHEYKGALYKLLENTPKIGRWDDILCIENNLDYAYKLFAANIETDALCAKWAPRKGRHSYGIRKAMGLTKEKYRRLLAFKSHTVENLMCDNQFGLINFSHVPSKAIKRYSKAFSKKATKQYYEWLCDIDKGEAKINAEAIWPHEIFNGYDIHTSLYKDFVKGKGPLEISAALKQWKALPNISGDITMFPLIDVSGSMYSPAYAQVPAIQIAISLGIYFSERNKGDYKNIVMTFSEYPEVTKLCGNTFEKYTQLNRGEIGNTNLDAALTHILDVAVKNKLKQEDIPDAILILSDMQFDTMGGYGDINTKQAIEAKFSEAGYRVPSLIFWNLIASANFPLRMDDHGACLVSGFSPNILKTLFECESVPDPISIMNKALSNPLYIDIAKPL